MNTSDKHEHKIKWIYDIKEKTTWEVTVEVAGDWSYGTSQ